MKHIHANQANKAIRSILSANDAVTFMAGHHYLMFKARGQKQTMTEKATEQFKSLFGDQENITKFVGLYETLGNISFTIVERVNSFKTVQSQRTLLGKLTDGCSHLRLYPDVIFS
jgi:hypothetical protein